MRVPVKKERYKVVYIPGDDSGHDVMEACMLVMEKLNPPIDWVRADAGWCMWEKYGDTVPPQTWKALQESDAALLSAITSKPGIKGFKSAVIQIRQKFDLYINLRPFKSLPGVPSHRPDIDIVLFRENTEDLYAGIEWRPLPEELYSLHPDLAKYKGKKDVAGSLRIFSWEGCERIIRAAFNYAREKGRRKVTVVEKPNVVRATGGMFLEVAETVAKDYPEIEWNIENVDATAMWLIKNPQNYDVMVTTNMFGDILSDECAQLVGGMGVVASGNIGDRYALFEPTHGSAPKYAGQYKINPTAMLMTAKMLLEYLDLNDYALKLEKAIISVLEEGRYVTYDILRDKGEDEKKAVSTLRMAEEIANRL
ncbi:MAG: isocitrate/isopropylmalate dehydrogenase family protein [Synergistetes bacterium]|nr:isocitrate/isopropylmalate dehydrogenase family protein [Synergistota bacterium]MDW8191469.1 isocitrate/isopropylmalate dehydrogenase family protein [Synergistota bacterium]